MPKKEKLDMEAIHRESKSKVMTILLGIALFCILSLFLLIIIEDRLFIKHMIYNFNNDVTTNISYEKIAGVYVNKEAVFPEDGQFHEDGGEYYDYQRLTINSDGTARYEDMGSHRSGYNSEGPIFFGKDKLYLVNNNCQEMHINGDKCEQPNCVCTYGNCVPSYTFRFTEGRIFIEDTELVRK